MRILILSLNFYPELIGIGKYTAEMAAWLSGRGNDIRVITAPPYYPDWKLSSGYRKYFWSKEEWSGVKVWRCPIWVPETPTGIKRLIHLASFALSSLPIVLWQIFWRPNIILTIEPPLFSAPSALIVARISGAKSILHIQDFEVDAAFDLGILKGRFLRNAVLNVERFLLGRFDLVSTISNRMIIRILSKGLSKEKIYFFPNWSNICNDLEPSTMSPSIKHDLNLTYRDRLNLPRDAIIALYTGNMGKKQGLELLGQVAVRFHNAKQATPPVHFVFCGTGAGRDDLLQYCKGLDRVHFLDLQPAECLSNFLSMADIHLLPQRGDAADLVMPSKLAGMLASGRPVLASVRHGTEIADIVQHCGMVVPPEEPEPFFDALLKLASDEQLRVALGQAGIQYARNNLNKDKILTNLEFKLIDVTQKS